VGARVLLVDDEVILVATLGRVLSAAGLEVDTARSGAEALERFRRNRYDVVVTDLTMEDVDGLEILRAVKRIDPDVCVTVVTGQSNEEAGIQALREGAEDYLFKPFQPEELVLRLRRQAETRALREKVRRYESVLGVCTACSRMHLRSGPGGKEEWVPLPAGRTDPLSQTAPALCPGCRSGAGIPRGARGGS